MWNLLPCALLLFAATAARGEEEPPRYVWRNGFTCLFHWLEYLPRERPWQYHPRDGREVLREEANAVLADRRAAAAFVAGQTPHPDAEPLLRKLLDDPDVIVRRIAAQSLFGVRALRKETAAHYRYTEVLTAEEKCRALAVEIARGGLDEEGASRSETHGPATEEERDDRLQAEIRTVKMRAHEATREMIALGRPAVWQLHRLTSHWKEEVALSAAYAFQEIGRRTANVAPLWVAGVERKLKQEVEFAFKDTPLTDAMAELSRLSGVEIRLSPDYKGKGWDGEPHLVTLEVKAMPLELALKWILRFHDLDYTISDGGIVVGWKMRIRYDVGPFFVDVRDLEATGLQPDWMQRFNDEVLGEDPWLGVPELATGLWNRGGILVIVVEEGPGRPEMMRPILAHLNKLREERGLPRGAE